MLSEGSPWVNELHHLYPGIGMEIEIIISLPAAANIITIQITAYSTDMGSNVLEMVWLSYKDEELLIMLII